MTGDANIPAFRDEDAPDIAAAWGAAATGSADRVRLVYALLCSLSGGAADAVRLAGAAASYGAARAAADTGAGETLNGLADDFDRLQATLLGHLQQRLESHDAGAAQLLAFILKIHRAASLARHAALAAFGHTLAAATRKRARIARHDIANAIGTVRNAIVLMQEETADTAREHFRAIAQRNSSSSEALVRSHLSDRAALTPAVGWQEISVAQLSGARNGTAESPRVLTNVAALDTMLEAVRAASGVGLTGGVTADPRISTTFELVSATSGMLTISVPEYADRPCDPAVLATLRELAVTIGLKLESDSTDAVLRLALPLSPRDERHDFSGAREGNHADAVRL